MIKRQRQEIQGCIDCEGFDYTFRDYSNWSDIEDEEFHKLRVAYIKAADELDTYIN